MKYDFFSNKFDTFYDEDIFDLDESYSYSSRTITIFVHVT